MPGAGLEANIPIDSHQLETEALVKGQAGRVRNGDAGVSFIETLNFQDLKQAGVQGGADTPSAAVWNNIDSHIDRPTVRRPLPVGAGIGEAGNFRTALA